jgi:hypothetical protein
VKIYVCLFVCALYRTFKFLNSLLFKITLFRHQFLSLEIRSFEFVGTNALHVLSSSLCFDYMERIYLWEDDSGSADKEILRLESLMYIIVYPAC